MTSFHVVAILILGLLLQEIVGFGILKALISPTFPKLMRVKSTVRSCGSRASMDEDPSVVLDFESLVQRHGYPAEEHRLTTTDGYKLVFHRIPGSPSSPKSKKKPVVFLQHGLIASSDHWVLFDSEKDLAFLLADAGYDVWLGNVRGNTYCREHIDLSPSNEEFWMFSYHEPAVVDVPAMIDYALEQANQKSLTFIGHSMGTTISYAMLSTRPEYNKKVHLVISLAPIAFFENKFSGALGIITSNGEEIERTLRDNKIYEVFPQSTMYAKLGQAFCTDKKITQLLCIGSLFYVSGLSPALLNTTILPHLTKYYPAGSSTSMLTHYLQNLKGFRQYDHGYLMNLALYGQKKPPYYNIKNVTAPVALYYGSTDLVSLKENALVLGARLPNVIKIQQVPSKTFNHLDFLWGINAKALLYDDVLDLCGKFRSE